MTTNEPDEHAQRESVESLYGKLGLVEEVTEKPMWYECLNDDLV